MLKSWFARDSWKNRKIGRISEALMAPGIKLEGDDKDKENNTNYR